LTERTWLVGAGFLALVAAYAVLSQLWVSSDAGWYASLRKPPWQPPDLVFGVIWPLNFLALAVAGVVLAGRAPTGGAVVLAVLAVSVGFALGWAYLFYVPHALTPAALSLTAAAALTWVVLVLAATAVWWLSLVLLPYAVWLSLAASLAWWYAAQ
jgi:tryptophan-rich sensory protein